MKKNRDGSIQEYYTLGITALFLLGFLLLVTFGAMIYQNSVASQSHNNETRSLLSYLLTSAKANVNGDISVQHNEDGDVLVIPDGDTGFATYITQNEGWLKEVYAQEGRPFSLSAANPIGKTELFEIEEKGDVIYIRTDEGRVVIHAAPRGE